MSVAETTIITALQTAIQSLAAFANADVVVNDFRIFDQWTGNAPYVILSTSDEFVSRMDTAATQTTWNIGITLIVEFQTSWKQALDDMLTHRQSIIDKFNSGNIRSASGEEGIDITEIASAGPILPRYAPEVEDQAEAEPIFMFQDMVVKCEEF